MGGERCWVGPGGGGGRVGQGHARARLLLWSTLHDTSHNELRGARSARDLHPIVCAPQWTRDAGVFIVLCAKSQGNRLRFGL